MHGIYDGSGEHPGIGFINFPIPECSSYMPEY